MRPQQQNRRMRGRNNSGGGGNNNNSNNNNRRGPNPLTRNYESNGPDVKIRGSAQQIAEKYATLARDAQSSGDRVMAENYLQHAEHYNRIIAAAQAQFASQQIQTARDDIDDDLDEASYGYEGSVNGGESQAPAAPVPAQQQQPQQAQPVNGSGPQPIIEGVPAEVALNSEPAGQQSAGGRHRDRRRQHHHNAMNGGNGAAARSPEETPEEAKSAAEAPQLAEARQAAEVPQAGPVAAAPETSEPQEKPRRGRKPRRSAADAAASEAASGEGEAAQPEG